MLCGTVGHRSVPRPALGVTRTQPWRCRHVASVAARAPAVPSGVAPPPPPEAQPMMPPPKEAKQAGPGLGPTMGANATQASAKTAAAPSSTTTAQGTPSSNTAAGTTTAAGAAAGWTHGAAVRMGREPDFAVDMGHSNKDFAKQARFITVHKYQLLLQGASASPAWQAELDAATPAVLAGWLLLDVPCIARLTFLAHKERTALYTMSAVMSTTQLDWETQHSDFKQWLQEQEVEAAPTITWPRSSPKWAVPAASGAPAAPSGVAPRPPPEAKPMTPPPKEANQVGPTPGPAHTTGADATLTIASTAAAPTSTTTAQGTPSSNTTTTPTGCTGAQATAGTTTAAGDATGLTREERQAAECLAAVIGRQTDFVINMALSDKGRSKCILKEPFITAYKHAVLLRGATAQPAWQAKLDAATPATLAGWVQKGVPHIMRLTYLVDTKRASNRTTLSGVMTTTKLAWNDQHPDFEHWVQAKGVDPSRTAVWPWSPAKRAAPAANATTTPTGSSVGKAMAGTAKAAGAAAGLTQEEHQAAVCVAAVIGRKRAFVLKMALKNKGILKEPFRTAYKHAVLVRGASARPEWQAKLNAATPTTLARWLEAGVPRIMRLAYLADMGRASDFSLSAVMTNDDLAWKGEHPNFQQWLQAKGVDPSRTAVWPWSPAKRAAPAASA